MNCSGCACDTVVQELSAKNYGQRFAALLFAEEIQNEIEMQQFDMMKVSSGEFRDANLQYLCKKNLTEF